LVDLVSRAVDHLVNNAGIGGKPASVENLRPVSEYTVMVSTEMLKDYGEWKIIENIYH